MPIRTRVTVEEFAPTEQTTMSHEFDIASRVARIADNLGIQLKIIVSHAMNPKKALVFKEALLELGSYLEAYWGAEKENRIACKLFSTVSREPVVHCYVQGKSAAEWLINYSLQINKEVNELLNLWLFESTDRAEFENNKKHWDTVRGLFDVSKDSVGLIHQRFQSQTASGRNVFSPKVFPTPAEIEQYREIAKWELDRVEKLIDQTTLPQKNGQQRLFKEPPNCKAILRILKKCFPRRLVGKQIRALLMKEGINNKEASLRKHELSFLMKQGKINNIPKVGYTLASED